MNLHAAEAISQSAGFALLGLLIRSLALVMAAAFLFSLLRRQTAELRHFVCRCALYGLLLLPAVEWVAPPFRQASATLRTAKVVMFSGQSTITTSRRAVPEAAITISPVRHRRFSWISFIAPVYLLIASILLVRLALNFLFLERLVRRSKPVFNSDMREWGHDIWLRSLSRYKPQIRVSEEVRVPVVAGIDEVTILLPDGWQAWPREKLCAVLAHEMAHVRRDDPQTTFLASLALCFFWLNPMVYWLRRQLMEQAEGACDEAALQETRSKEYAQILIEFATEVGRQGSRLAAVSTAVVHKSLLGRRIEYLFSIQGRQGGKHYMIRALSVAVLAPALYLTAAARFGQEGNGSGKTAGAMISVANQQQADQWEAQLREDPENLQLRGVLMGFYANERNDAAFTSHLLWAIHHHPEAPIAAMRIYRRPDSPSQPLQRSLAIRVAADGDRQLIRAAWENALSQYPDSPDVAFHAGLFWESEDPQRALDLFQRAQKLTPADAKKQTAYLRAVSVIYAAAVIAELNGGDPLAQVNNIAMDQDLAQRLHTAIKTSIDPSLLSQTGMTLVHLGQDQEGLSLIQRAINLDPMNPTWKETLESAKAEPVRRQNQQRIAVGPTSHSVRIGAQVAEANLISKVEPIYPPLARQARISGTVEFTIDIGADGKVQSLQLVRGHPLLVNAAKEAVLQWVYRPTLLDGNPVPVTTTAEVTFNFPQ